MSNIVLALTTIICVLFMLPLFYYVPRCVLSAVITVVGLTLLEEAPPDILFFLQIGAYSELATMVLVFLTTLVWSIQTGIAVGVGISLITVLKHATRARTQILGRDPATRAWRPLEDAPAARLEQAPSILVIKIREALTFANAGELERRLWRIDRYGDARAHPSLPRLRSGVRSVVFDVAGVASIDGSGTIVLKQMVLGYVARGVGVWFCRVSGGDDGKVARRMRDAGIVDACMGRVVDGVEEAVQAADEVEARRGGV